MTGSVILTNLFLYGLVATVFGCKKPALKLVRRQMTGRFLSFLEMAHNHQPTKTAVLHMTQITPILLLLRCPP